METVKTNIDLHLALGCRFRVVGQLWSLRNKCIGCWFVEPVHHVFFFVGVWYVHEICDSSPGLAVESLHHLDSHRHRMHADISESHITSEHKQATITAT